MGGVLYFLIRGIGRRRVAIGREMKWPGRDDEL